MAKTTIARWMIRMERCPACRHIKAVKSCQCTHRDCVCTRPNNCCDCCGR